MSGVDQSLIKFAQRNKWWGAAIFASSFTLMLVLFFEHCSAQARSREMLILVILAVCSEWGRVHTLRHEGMRHGQSLALVVLAAVQGTLVSMVVLVLVTTCDTDFKIIWLPLVTMLLGVTLASAVTTLCLFAFIAPFVIIGIGLMVQQSWLATPYFERLVWTSGTVLFCGGLAVFAKELRHVISASFEVAQYNRTTNLNLKAAVREARKANQSKTRFLASASHDLRQPINALALFIASLKLQTETPEQQAIIASMTTAIQSIDSQLESLLDISKLDAGIVQVCAQAIELGRFCQHLVISYADYFDPDILTLEFSRPQEELWVSTDPALLERVLQNVLSNSIKYTPTGRVSVSLSGSSNWIKISIQDTGIGMARAELSRVFDEFYQISNPQRDASRGLGLGLSIVQRLATLLRIHVLMRSKLGVGTLVQFKLDRINPTHARKTLPSSVKQGFSSRRVLVLDNETEILSAMHLLLERMGHQPVVFDRAEAAVLGFIKAKFDIALVDYRLTGNVTGIDVIRQLQRLDSRTRCFLVTGDGGAKQNATNINVIYKPLTAAKLAPIFLDYQQQ